MSYGLMTPIGRLLPRPHDHAWVVDDRAGLQRFETQLGELYGRCVDAQVQHQARVVAAADTSLFLPGGTFADRQLLDPAVVATSPDYRRAVFAGADPVLLRRRAVPWLPLAERCPWAPCGESRRTVSAGGTDPDESAGWAGDAVDLTPALLRSVGRARLPRQEAVALTGLRPDLVTIFADAFGAGDELTVVDLLTLSALSPVDWLPPQQHVAAHRQVRAWWEAGPVDLDAVLVVHREGAAVLPRHEGDLLADEHSPVHLVPLQPGLRGLVLALSSRLDVDLHVERSPDHAC